MKPNTLSVVNCASGQDRTGTALEKATQLWMKLMYIRKGLLTAEQAAKDVNIESMRAEGGNAAEITAHHLPGSPGMKKESQAGATFSKEATEQMYRSSANTNKKNPVGDVSFLKQPSDQAVKEYQANLEQYEAELADYEKNNDKNQQLVDKGHEILTQVKKLAGDPVNKKSITSKHLSDLNSVLVCCKETLENPDNTENARKLAGLSKAVSGKTASGWKVLGGALLTFACLALVVVGVLAAIPTGGTSLLLTAVGATGLSTGVAAGIGAAAVGAATASGVKALNKGREKGLASSVSKFKNALEEMQSKDGAENKDEEKNRPSTT